MRSCVSTARMLQTAGAGWVALLVSLSAAAQQATPVIDPATGVVHSRRLASGVPFGGIGCGTFQILTDGTISRATINNNWEQPTGDLNGCFAAIWTNAGGRIVARSLRLTDPYHLPVVRALDYGGLFPQAVIQYPDTALPVRLRLRAYSALVPHDVRSSATPAAILVFSMTNESRAPVEASIALSWEAFLGVGVGADGRPASDRTGNRVSTLALPEGLFGMKLESPPEPTVPPADRLHYNSIGEYALVAEGTAPETQATAAGWNALDPAPAWWDQFAKDGTVAGEVGAGKEGSIHPAAVLAIRVPLKDRETREIPFAVAWYTPRLWTVGGSQYGHAYERTFPDAVAVARYALGNRLALSSLTAEWQDMLLRSNLPSWLPRKLINDAAVLFTNSILTRDSGLGGKDPGPSMFGMLSSAGGGSLGAVDQRLLAQWLLACWFPMLDSEELHTIAATQAPDGPVSNVYGRLSRGFAAHDPEDVDRGRSTNSDATASFAFMVYRHYLATGDQRFLDQLYPAAKHAIQAAAAARTADGLPSGGTVYGDGVDSYKATLWLGALRTSALMADLMQDREFAGECRSLAEAARGSILARLWNGRFLRTRGGTETSFASQLAGVWMADAVDAGEILPARNVASAIDALIALHDHASTVAPPLVAALDGTVPAGTESWPSHSATYQATLYALEGRPEAGMTLLQRVDELDKPEGRDPWTPPLARDASTGAHGRIPSPISDSSSWNFLQAIEGILIDQRAGRLVLTPHLPKGMPYLSAPVLSPVLFGWMEYRPGPRRTLLSFRVDRLIPAAAEPAKLQRGADLVLRSVVLPAPPGTEPQVTASVGRAPVNGKLSRDDRGRLVFTAETALQLTAGSRLEFVLR